MTDTRADAQARLVIGRPDDWHVHFRDGAALGDTVPPIARVFGRAVAMPNLKPPARTTAEALAYAARIRAAVAREEREALAPAFAREFTPLVSLYLTDLTAPAEIHAAKAAGLIAAKLYPAGATTHSDAGVTDVHKLAAVFAAMAETGLVLQLHGEVTDPEVDVFDREAVFVERVLAPLVAAHPGLRIVLEHVTTAAGVAFVAAAGPNVAATVTPHHLMTDRNAMFRGGLRPHAYCLPVPKTRADREALVRAATGAGGSDGARFFLGSDSAPHPREAKEAACCAAGVYTGPAVLELCAEVFEAAGALAALEAFVHQRGADFFGLPRNAGTVTLVREAWTVPATYPLGASRVVPHRAGEVLAWRVADAD